MKNIHNQYSIFKKKIKDGNDYKVVEDHRPKTKAEQKGIRKFMKKYERTNKDRGVKAEIRGK